MIGHLQKQVNFFDGIAKELSDKFEEPVQIRYVFMRDGYLGAEVICESDHLIKILKLQLFTWQLGNIGLDNSSLIKVLDNSILEEAA